MSKLNREQVMNSEYLEEYQTEQEYDGSSENIVTKHIFELKDILSYEILKQELTDTLDIDKKPLFLDSNARNIVRIISENIDNLEIIDADDKFYLNTFREEIRQLVLEHLSDTYKISYNINENDDLIDLEPIADLYEFFIMRKLNNIFKYYYATINMSIFDKTVEEDQRGDMLETLRNFLIRNAYENAVPDDLSNEEITMDVLSKFFNNRFNIIDSGILNISGMSSFLNFIITVDDGEMVSDRIREMFYNFGGFNGIEFEDTDSFKNYVECLIELENANELLVMLASKVFETRNM